MGRRSKDAAAAERPKHGRALEQQMAADKTLEDDGPEARPDARGAQARALLAPAGRDGALGGKGWREVQTGGRNSTQMREFQNASRRL